MMHYIILFFEASSDSPWSRCESFSPSHSFEFLLEGFQDLLFFYFPSTLQVNSKKQQFPILTAAHLKQVLKAVLSEKPR